MLETRARKQHVGVDQSLITASWASPFSPFSVITRLPVNPGA